MVGAATGRAIRDEGGRGDRNADWEEGGCDDREEDWEEGAEGYVGNYLEGITWREIT